MGMGLMVSEQIRSGRISTLDQFLAQAYREGFSDEQIRRLGKEILDSNYKRANGLLTSAAGIIGWEINPSEAKIEKKLALDELFRINLGKNMQPEEAAREAISQYNNSESTKKREAIKSRVSDNVRQLLESQGFTMPQVDIENMDLGSLRDGRGRPLSDSLRARIQAELAPLRAAP